MCFHYSKSEKTIGILFLVAFLLIVPVSAIDLPFIRPFPAAGGNNLAKLNEIKTDVVLDTAPWQTWSEDGEFLGNLSGNPLGMSGVTAPTLIRQKTFGGSEEEHGYNWLARETPDGGYVLTSSYSLSNDGDVSGNHGKKDIWIAKLRNNWSIEWQKSLGGSGDDVASTFEFSDDNKTFLIFGSTTSNDGDVSGNHGGTDIWVVNMSLNGTVLWQRCYGGSGEETDFSVSKLYSSADPGRMLIMTSSSNDGNIIGNHGGKDVCIIKLFPNFTINWQKCYGGTGVEVKTSFQQEQINHNYSYALTAFTNSNNGDVSGNHGGFDSWIVKINANGTIFKQTCLGGSKNDNTTSNSVWFNKDGNTGKYDYLGTTWSNDGDASGNHGGTDIWYMKIDGETLVPETQRCFGGSGNDTHSVLLSDYDNQDDNFTIIGRVKSNDGDVTGFHGGTDIWIADVQKDLSVTRQKSLGGSGEDKMQSLSSSSDRSVLYMIVVSNSTDGDITGNHGGYDACYMRLTDGSVDWQKCFGGTQDENGGTISLKNDGSALMSIMTNSNDGDVSGNHGKTDFWLAQLSSGIRADFSADQTSGLVPLDVHFSDRSDGAVVNRSWDFGDGTTSTEKYPSHTYSIPGNFTSSLTVYGNYSHDVKTTVIQVKQVPPSPPIIWQKTFGNYSDATGIQETTDGGYVVAGYTLANFVNFSFWNYDYWIVKLDENGVLEWEKSLGGSAEDIALGIRQTADGGYIVAGGTKSTDGNVSGNHGGYDYWIVKLDTSRNIQWQKALGGSGDDIAYSVRQTADGRYIVAGMSNSTDGDVSGNHGNPDYWLVKLDTNGNLLWQKSFGGSAEDAASTVRQTSDGGYIIAGQSQSNDGNVSGNHGYYDYWIVKTDTNGNLQWQKSFGGSSDDVAYSIEQTNDSGYIIAGSTQSYDGDVTGYDWGYEDYWIVKTDNKGILQWEKCLGGSDSDVAASIQPTRDNGYIVAGSSKSDDGDVRGHHGDSGYSGPYDYWVVKLAGDGEIQWQKPLGGNSTDIARSIQQTRDGGYIVGGYSQSNDGDVSGNSGIAYWIVKLASSVSGNPVANFNANVTSGRAPLTVKFTDTSTGSLDTWNWTFGDGNIMNATVQNPVHTYLRAGNYTVSLKVTSAGKFDILTRNGYINVTNAMSKIGVFRNSTHLFYLDYNGNGAWNGASVDRQYTFGITGDIPLSGDWDNNGKYEIGVFRPSTHLFYLDYNGNGVWNGASVDRQYNFGISGDIPLSGDWNNDGKSEIGAFRNSTHLFYLDYNGNGAWNGASVDRQYNFGITGDIPVTGDWNNNGAAEIGVFRNSTHLFYLDYNGNGAWNGASVDRQYNFGITGDIPVYGDWKGDGYATIGVFRPSTHLFYLDYNGNGAWNGASVDRQYNFGITGDIPISGKW